MNTTEAVVDQPKVWSHPRDVTIKFPKTSYEQEQFVTFRVEQAGAEAFQKILNEYFYFCKSREATVTIVDEITDAESKEPCAFTAKIEGARSVVGQEMQRVGMNFMKHSTRIR
jgi:hypothetical protein